MKGGIFFLFFFWEKIYLDDGKIRGEQVQMFNLDSLRDEDEDENTSLTDGEKNPTEKTVVP